MELHILEHSLKVASIAKEGIQICTHGLIKLAFLASKTRCVTSPERVSSVNAAAGLMRTGTVRGCTVPAFRCVLRSFLCAKKPQPWPVAALSVCDGPGLVQQHRVLTPLMKGDVLL